MAQYLYDPPGNNSDENSLLTGKETSFSMASSSGKTETIEETEFKERHGEQYHLRHHLSGCAQALYTIDFANDFSTGETATQSALPSLNPTEQAIYEASFSLPATMVETADTQLQPTESLIANQNTAILVDAGEQTLINLESNGELIVMTPPAEEPLIPTLPDSVELASSVAETEAALNAPQVTNFDDASLGGWQLNASLAPEQVLENGQLHFTGGMLQQDTPLLQQSLLLAAGQSYQLGMSVQFSEGSEPPRFNVMVDGVATEMTSVRQGDSYTFSAEFIASTGSQATVAIVPVGTYPASQSVWLDNLVIQPHWPELPHLDLQIEPLPLPVEPIFNFAELTVNPPVSASLPEKKLDLSAMLSKAGPEIVFEDSVAETELMPILKVETMMGESVTENWNTVQSPLTDLTVLTVADFAVTQDFSSLENVYTVH